MPFFPTYPVLLYQQERLLRGFIGLRLSVLDPVNRGITLAAHIRPNCNTLVNQSEHLAFLVFTKYSAPHFGLLTISRMPRTWSLIVLLSYYFPLSRPQELENPGLTTL